MKPNLALSFPLKGLDRAVDYSSQPPLTSPDLLNVRPFDVAENRTRGGQRPGLKILYNQSIGGATDTPCVCILQITTIAE